MSFGCLHFAFVMVFEDSAVGSVCARACVCVCVYRCMRMCLFFIQIYHQLGYCVHLFCIYNLAVPCFLGDLCGLLCQSIDFCGWFFIGINKFFRTLFPSPSQHGKNKIISTSNQESYVLHVAHCLSRFVCADGRHI